MLRPEPLPPLVSASLEILDLTLQVNGLSFECFDAEIESSEFVFPVIIEFLQIADVIERGTTSHGC